MKEGAASWKVLITPPPLLNKRDSVPVYLLICQQTEVCPRSTRTVLSQSGRAGCYPIGDSFVTSNAPPALHKTTMIDQPVHIHPENGSCNCCWNVGQLPIFNTAHTQGPKFYIVFMLLSWNINSVYILFHVGTHDIHALVLGRAITGISAFSWTAVWCLLIKWSFKMRCVHAFIKPLSV
jgi:hypothetical protein